MSMRTIKTLAVAAVLAALASPAAAQSSVTGVWTASFVTADRTYPAKIDLKQEKDQLTGTVGGDPSAAPNNLTGTIKGNDLSFSFSTPDPSGSGRVLAIEVKATAGSDGLSGTFTVDGEPTGTFAAKRDAKDKDSKEPKASGPAADVSGTWAFTVDLGSITATPTVLLKQDGQSLTGTYTSTQYGQFPLKGTVNGDKIDFAFTMSIEGNALDVHFAGTADKDGLKGTVNYGGVGEGTFTGKKR
jgi:hypothetical protein